VQLLLDKGTDANVRVERYGSAVQAAPWEHRMDMVQLMHPSMETSTNGNDESTQNQRATRVHNCSHRVISYVKNDKFQHRIRVGKFSICGLNESEIRRSLFSHSLLLLEDGACNFLAWRLSEGGCQLIRS
jgi:hypothetical protein